MGKLLCAQECVRMKLAARELCTLFEALTNANFQTTRGCLASKRWLVAGR